MNDFTKEELEDLYYAIRHFWKNRCSHDLPSDEGDISHSYELMQKIQSMIDNYHEPSEETKEAIAELDSKELKKYQSMEEIWTEIKEESGLDDRISTLQDSINDLRWRMDKVHKYLGVGFYCNHEPDRS